MYHCLCGGGGGGGEDGVSYHDLAGDVPYFSVTKTFHHFRCRYALPLKTGHQSINGNTKWIWDHSISVPSRYQYWTSGWYQPKDKYCLLQLYLCLSNITWCSFSNKHYIISNDSMYHLYHADIQGFKIGIISQVKISESGPAEIRISYHVVNCKHGVISLLVEWWHLQCQLKIFMVVFKIGLDLQPPETNRRPVCVVVFCFFVFFLHIHTIRQ